ncbi:MAG: hypothetical protein WCJ64_22005 [Rhodospirillaceae bacterium]
MTALDDQIMRMFPALIVILLVMPAVVRLSGSGRRIVRWVTVAVFAVACCYSLWLVLVWAGW